MIHARGTEFNGEPNTSRFAELAGVHPRPEATLLSGGEDAPGLVDIEGTVVAEDVHPAGARCTGVEHLAGDQLDVACRVIDELHRNDMGSQIGGLLGELAGDGQQPRLVDGTQAVAALDFDSCGALGPHFGDQMSRIGGQFGIRGATSQPHCATDASRGIRLPGHPMLELF